MEEDHQKFMFTCPADQRKRKLTMSPEFPLYCLLFGLSNDKWVVVVVIFAVVAVVNVAVVVVVVLLLLLLMLLLLLLMLLQLL